MCTFPNKSDSHGRPIGKVVVFAGSNEHPSSHSTRHDILTSHFKIHEEYWENRGPIYNSNHNDIALVPVYPPFNFRNEHISKIALEGRRQLPRGIDSQTKMLEK